MTERIPLSPGQRRIRVAARSGDAYNQPFVLRFDGPLDVGALRDAFDAVVRRHPPLRSRIAEDGAHLVADRWPAPRWEIEDVADADAEAVAFGRAPVDLAAGPLVRTRLLRAGPADHRLLVSQHHIVSDERSVAVFTGELLATYADRVAGRPSPGEPLDYPGYWRDRLRREDERRATATRSWSEYLAGAPELADLPTVSPRPVPGDPRRAEHRQTFDAEFARRLDRLARAHRASLYMVCKAALDVVLSAYGPGDVVTGVALDGRDTAEAAGLIGFLASPVVLRSDVSGDPTFAELLGRVRGAVLDAHERGELPLDEVLDALGHARDLSHHPLYQVMFSAGRREPARQVAGVTVRLELPPLASMKVDLDVGVTDTGSGLDVVFGYRADLFDPATAAAMAEHYGAVLRAVAADPYRPVAELRGLPERASTGTPAPYGGGLLARFLRAAEANPDAIAVAAGSREWTYARLRAAVEHLAAALGTRRPEARIGVCAGPAPETVAALLAVPMAGGTTVPVDPARPVRLLRDRIAALGLDAVLVDDDTAPLLSEVDIPLVGIASGQANPPIGTGPAHADQAVWVADDLVLTNANLDSVHAAAGTVVLADPLDSTRAVEAVVAALSGGFLRFGESWGPDERPVSGVLHVLDDTLRPVPPGAVGHLYVAGAPQGCLDRPGRTATVFVADPFGPPGARMTATGDLVRRYADGRLYRVGRAGECVRRLGVLISPVPAETALNARPDVTLAGVVVTEDGRLLAGVQGPAEHLRDDLAAVLPAYLVPDRVVDVGVVPLSRSGAIDRARLLTAVSGARTPDLLRPVTRVEREVARAWRAVLGRPAETGRTFFEMGGDSVRLIRLRGMLVAALGCQLDVVELFRHPTARAMAAHLESVARPAASGSTDRGAARGRTRQQVRRRAGVTS